MKEYCFPAACSPKELRDRIEQRVREEQARELVRKVNKESWSDLKLTWREELEFDFRFARRENFRSEGVCVGAGPGSLSLEAGTREEKSWSFSETFQGRLEPDGEGGSVLRGRFRLWGWSSGFFVIFSLLCALLGMLTQEPLTWLGIPLAAVQWLRHLKRLDKYPASQTILAFFEDVTRTIETDAERECLP